MPYYLTQYKYKVQHQISARLLGSGRAQHGHHLRRIRFKDPDTGKTLVFLTNNFAFPAATICALYKRRWQVELFFKWIKQHLRIKKFYGNSELSLIHISEPTRLGMISYAVFCLKKKKKKK